MTSGANLAGISHSLVSARRAAKALPGFPGELPTSFADAYRVQAMSRADWSDPVAGWKVGGVAPALQDVYGATHLTGPIFRSAIYVADSSGLSNDMPVFVGGFAAVEAEFIYQFGETSDADRLFVGAEVASSILPDINGIGPLAVVCEFGNNNGLVVGQEIADWQTADIGPVEVTCHIDDVQVGQKIVPDIRAAIAPAIAFFVDHAARHDIVLEPGTYVATGAITGIHEAEAGASSVLRYGELGSVDLTLVQAQPA